LPRVVFLVAVERGFGGVLGLAAGFLATGFLAVAFLVGAGFAGARFAGAGGGASSATGSGAGAGSGSAAATPIELESVRWHVSQLTIVRTSPPRWCSSRRRLRERLQKLQKPTSVTTSTCPGRLAMPTA
jgi:hypothetical protein